MQVLYTGGVKSVSKWGAVREGSSTQPIELSGELSREGSSIQLIGQTCELCIIGICEHCVIGTMNY